MAFDTDATMMAQHLLQATGVCCYFGEFQAVKSTDFIINAGETIVLTGPNGAGKTTLLYCIAGIMRPTRGNVLIEGYDLYQEEVSAKQRLAFVPDVPRFYPSITTWEHLKFISLAHGISDDWESRAEGILHQFGMWESRDLYPHNLSRGMRLKLGISLALIRPFKVLVMDEPTSALDPESGQIFQEKLADIRKDGCGILLTSHDPKLAETLGARSWRMESGQLDTG
ncbi:MAG: ABC transporter ATP-binding protein [Acidobacteriaceae bacterium]